MGIYSRARKADNGEAINRGGFQMKERETHHRLTLQDLVITALMIALTFGMTFINVRLPIAANGGLVHLGNIPLLIAAVIFGKRTGALAGGIGMALFDLVGGWTLWAPFTFVIVGLMGYVVGAMTEKHCGYRWYMAAIAAACAIKIAGYYVAESIIYGNWLAPVASIPGNLVQMGLAAVVVLAVVGRLNLAAARIGLQPQTPKV
jgi:uncharacterized membrane protein